MEPIAIVGLGCRFPGGPDPASFWRLLRDGGEAIRETPPDRWDADALYDPDPEAPGKMTTRRAGFLEQIDQFDPAFFGISPREARSMDPQQRLLLEVAWEALEHAGLPPPQLAGTATGVFIGICSFDYAWRQAGDLTLTEAYSGTGAAHSIAANRLSYLLDLRGPSMAVDTACSSSLIAVHLACQSIWRGESTMALAGGVNVIASPEGSIGFSKARMTARDGHCKTFDAGADGYVRGEGSGIVVLKPLAVARRDGDTILALVRGTATNQDGRSNGLTAPNGPAQQAVIREALRIAGVTPNQVGFVEAHGTGTPLGDPIELQALVAALGKGRTANKPLVVGSVKPNIGHLEGAAGIAALIKAVLCLQNEEIAPQINFSTLNPLVRPSKRLVIPTEPRLWPRGATPRIAGVSSFGFGGANAHVVLEEAPLAEEARATQAGQERPTHLLTVSARTESALRVQAGQLAERLAQRPDLSLRDLCFSAATTRAHFEHRLAATAASTGLVRAALDRFAAGMTDDLVQSGRIASRSGLRVAFIFTGQGSQYPGMGRQLYGAEPTFRRALDNCAEILVPFLGRPLLDVLYAEGSDTSCLHDTAYAQPALFSLEYALTELWRSWGVEPSVLLGHSVGEYVAACVAGVFTLEDGLRLVAERGRLMQALPETGAMAAVLADEARVSAAIAPYLHAVSIAAVNGPDSTVISGETGAVEAIVTGLERDRVVCRRLNVSSGFHSPLMEPMLDNFERAAREVQFSAPTLPLVSNVTGQLWQSGQVPDAAYWRRHAREAVRFADGVRVLADRRCAVSLEIGPQPTLTGLARRCEPDGAGLRLASLQKGRGHCSMMLESLSAMYTRGLDVDWIAFHRDHPGRRVHLPTYPFERERYWVERRPLAWERPEPALAVEHGLETSHPLLGRRLSTAHPTFETTLTPSSPSFLADHRVRGTVLLPATAYLEIAAVAAARALNIETCSVSDVHFKQAVILTEGEPRRLQVSLVPADAETWSWSVHSQLARSSAGGDSTGVSWTLHAQGYVRRLRAEDTASTFDLDGQVAEIKATADEKATAEHYRDLEARGYQYGPTFQAIDQLWRSDGEAFGRLVAPRTIAADLDRYHLHPAMLDAAAQILAAAITPDESAGSDRDTFVPVGLDELRVHGQLGPVAWCRASLTHCAGQDDDIVAGDCTLYDERGLVIAEIRGLRSQRLRVGGASHTTVDTDDWLYEIAWRSSSPAWPSPHTPKVPHANGSVTASLDQRGTSSERASWLILADRGGTAEALAARLEARGDDCLLVTPGAELAVLAPDRVAVDPTQPEHIRQALALTGQDGAPPLRGVIHLWSLDLPSGTDLSPVDLDRIELLACGGALHLVQAIMRKGDGIPPRLWLVTRGATAVGGDAPGPVAAAQAPLWGLGRTIMHEQPGLRCSLVDLDPTRSPDDVDALLAELCADDREDQIAYRGDVRHVARLARSGWTARSPQTATIRPDATYLVTGGLGALGLVVAGWLVERGARNLVLVGRRPPSTEAQRTVDALTEKARIEVVAADVAREEDVRALLNRIAETLPPLRGVIHAAGVLDGGPATKLSIAQLRSVMGPKVRGTRHLHVLTADLSLDFFVLFSSVTSVLGSPGQSNYAAANAFLDAVAHDRQAAGLPGLSVNWGAWAEAGMAARIADGGWQIPDGIGTIVPGDGVGVLSRLMAEDRTQVTVVPIDWARLRRFAGPAADRPLVDDLDTMTATEDRSEVGTVDATSLLASSPEERQARLEAYLRLAVARLLQRDPVRIDLDRPLHLMGLDSLTGSVLTNRIEADLTVTLPVAKLAEGPTISELAAELADLLPSASLPALEGARDAP